MTDQCDHGQLYAQVSVTFMVPIEHNSAIQISKARDLVISICSQGYELQQILTWTVDQTIKVKGGDQL